MKKIALSCLMVLSLANAKAGDSIQLPSGTTVKIDSFAFHPKWKELFPVDNEFFVEKHGDGSLKGIHSRHSGRLDGASVVLHENGNVKLLGFYPGGQRQGPFRVWDEEKHLLLYAKYQDNKKHGITCLFKDGTPWFIQEWDKGALQNETVLAPGGNGFVAVDDAPSLADAQKRLSTVEKDFVKLESDVKNGLRKWYSTEHDLIKKEKEKAQGTVAQARHDANEQAKEKERAEAALTQSKMVERSNKLAALRGAEAYAKGSKVMRSARIGGAASVVRENDAKENRAASRNLKAANENVKTTTKQANQQLTQMDQEIAENNAKLDTLASLLGNSSRTGMM